MIHGASARYRRRALSTPSLPSILVIGLDAAFYEGLGVRLRDVGRYEHRHAPTGAEGIALARATDPSLVVLAWSLPDGRGLDLCNRLLTHDPVPLVFVADDANEEARIAGFTAGARDFVVAPVSLRELSLRIRAILRRRTETRRREVRVGSLAIDRVARHVWVGGQTVALERVEMDLLLALPKDGRACSREELRERAWRDEAAVELRSVDSCIRRLRQQLGVAGRHIETVRNVGYRLGVDKRR